MTHQNIAVRPEIGGLNDDSCRNNRPERRIKFFQVVAGIDQSRGGGQPTVEAAASRRWRRRRSSIQIPAEIPNEDLPPPAQKEAACGDALAGAERDARGGALSLRPQTRLERASKLGNAESAFQGEASGARPRPSAAAKPAADGDAAEKCGRKGGAGLDRSQNDRSTASPIRE